MMEGAGRLKDEETERCSCSLESLTGIQGVGKRERENRDRGWEGESKKGRDQLKTPGFGQEVEE